MRDDEVVGLSLTGDIEVEPIVAQGCRAVGPLFEVRPPDGPGSLISPAAWADCTSILQYPFSLGLNILPLCV